MNNNNDCNKINIKMILENFHIIGSVLLNLINESLTTGDFPKTWKDSLVIPVEKVYGTKNCEELRPINMLSIYGKILETVVHNQLVIYVETNDILIEEQSGFRKNHSCESALNLMISSGKKYVKTGQ